MDSNSAWNSQDKRDNEPPPLYQPYTISGDQSGSNGVVSYYQGQQVMYTTSPTDFHGNPSVIVVTQPPTDPVPQYVPVKQSFCCHIFWSCFAFWLCGIIFGMISFILAIFARKSSEEGNHSEANRLGKASMSITIIGVLLGCAAWGFVIWYLVTYYIYGYWMNGLWYRYVNCYISSTTCWNYPYYGSYSNGCCYYN